MDMKISGAGFLPGGEYEAVNVSGSGRSEGLIRCESFTASGGFYGKSDILCTGQVTCSGSFKNEGKIEAGQIRASGGFKNEGDIVAGSIAASGAAHITGNCCVKEQIKTSGALSCDGALHCGTVHCTGSARIGEDITAEKASFVGGVRCGGLLNAEEIYIGIASGSSGEIRSIGGGHMTVKDHKAGSRFIAGVSRLFGRKAGILTVAESIEADEIDLENTVAEKVVGRNVRIGKGCKIGVVYYSDTLETDPAAQINKIEKI